MVYYLFPKEGKEGYQICSFRTPVSYSGEPNTILTAAGRVGEKGLWLIMQEYWGFGSPCAAVLQKIEINNEGVNTQQRWDLLLNNYGSYYYEDLRLGKKDDNDYLFVS